MLNYISFSDEITVWWDKSEFPCRADGYLVDLNGRFFTSTAKTHFTAAGLSPDTEYEFLIKALSGKAFVYEKRVIVSTKKAKRAINVALAPYNASGDGKTMNTKAIQKAIDDCTENDYVYIPQGVFLTGALNLKSDLEIYVAENAVVKGSALPQDYLPMKRSRFEGTERDCYRSLLNFGEMDHKKGCTSKNLVIRGAGSILGGGRELLDAVMESGGAVYDENGPVTAKDGVVWRSRGRLIEVCNAENVVISGLTLGMSPSWNLHFIYSENIVTCNCTIKSQGINNGDGWDPDSCKNCAVFNCDFFTGDDMIAIKSGKNPEGNVIARPCENIYIFDCRSHGGHGMSVGSEMSGGVRGVFVWDCDFCKCWYGFQIKATKKRGGYVKDVFVSDSKLSCVLIWSVGYNDDGAGDSEVPVFDNFNFDGNSITGTDYFVRVKTSPYVRYVYIEGFGKDNPVTNVCFNKTDLFIGDNNAVGFETKYVSDLKTEEVKYH